MDFDETIPYFYPDQALRDFWVKWSETALSYKPKREQTFQEALGSIGANDRSRAKELYEVGLTRGTLVTPQELGRVKPLGWSMLEEGDYVHTTLGYLAYLFGKTEQAGSISITQSFSALCAIFSLQIGIRRTDGFQLSYAALLEYLKQSFPLPVDVQETVWLRYLAAGMFSTIQSYAAETSIENLVNNHPIDRLVFRWKNGEEVDADYDTFCSLISERQSVATLIKAKHNLFFIGSETDQRGVYSQALKYNQSFLSFYGQAEIQQLQQGLRGKGCFNYPFLHKDPLVETPDIIQKLLKLTHISPDWQRIVAQLMKTLQTGCIEAVSMLYGQDIIKQIQPVTSISEPPALSLPDLSRNRILYGPPGSGKSFKIDDEYANGYAQIRVTFHPDSDYNSFVGSYKPISDADGHIHYNFVPQAFTNAYVSAWGQPDRAVFLIIEEINRGNCAQIFGDLFQCLDRNAADYSVYPVDADTDLANYLRKAFSESPVAAEHFASQAPKYKNVGSTDYHKLILPRNLYLYATMNTSDQSLFPMDSAFKRRWEWEYVPIDYKKAELFTIVLSDRLRYSWGAFIKAVNDKIFALNASEDKQLGNRFVNPANTLIDLAMFKSKVMFYLWSEIYKNEVDHVDNIFVTKPDPTKADIKPFTFSQLYEKKDDDTGRDLDLLPAFMANLNVPLLPVAE